MYIQPQTLIGQVTRLHGMRCSCCWRRTPCQKGSK